LKRREEKKMRGLRLSAVGIFLVAGLFFPAEVFAQGASVSPAEGGNGLLLARIEALERRVGELEDTVAAQQETITQLRNRLGNLGQLNGFVRVETGDINGLPGPHIIFEGANIHIRNGNTSMATYNCDPAGLGNLIIGYNEENPDVNPQLRSGCHNLVVGSEHNYTGFGGFIVGFSNTISGAYSSVSGGFGNTASGEASSVSGGELNTANGILSSISGGIKNIASEFGSSISGGKENTASGRFSSVSGGFGNTASGQYSSVSGGASGTADVTNCWIGGTLNEGCTPF